MSDPQECIREFFQKYKITADEPVAVAVSGGPDSMALAHSIIASEQNRPIHVLTVDHGLRQEARDEAESVSRWVSSLSLPNVQHVILFWDHDNPKAALMEKARHARYQILSEYCQKNHIEYLFVAHHQDDQAETFLIRLSKGSGLDGLSGMTYISDYHGVMTLSRPFLQLSKEELIAYCQQNEISYVDDPSNKNDDFLRPRLRKSMNVLQEEGLTSKRLAVTAKRIARARNALEILTDKLYQEAIVGSTNAKQVFDLAVLTRYPEELVLRVLQKVLRHFREDEIYDVRMERLEDLFESLWHDIDSFKPRTLGGAKFLIVNKQLIVERE